MTGGGARAGGRGRRLVRQLLIESFFLALMAGTVGLALAVVGIRWFVPARPWLRELRQRPVEFHRQQAARVEAEDRWERRSAGGPSPLESSEGDPRLGRGSPGAREERQGMDGVGARTAR